MVRKLFACAALASALGAASSQGAIRWYDDYPTALDAAKKTGRPIVVVFSREGDRHAKLVKRIFEKNELAPFHRRFVFIYLEVSMAGNTFSHGLFNKYNPGPGGHQFPIIFYAGTDEKVISKAEGSQRASDVATDMKQALEKHGPVASVKKAHDAEKGLERAKALIEKERFGPAARLLQEVIALDLKIPATETAKAELAKIEERASKLLEAARLDLKDKAYRHAVARLLELEGNFPTLEAGKAAHKELAALRKLPEAKDAFEGLEETEAQTELRTDAVRHTDDPNDIDNDFFTDEEIAALDEMAKGEAAPEPAAKPEGTSGECRRLLSLARSWIANKRPDKARELLERVIAKEPNSIYADQAKAILKTLD